MTIDPPSTSQTQAIGQPSEWSTLPSPVEPTLMALVRHWTTRSGLMRRIIGGAGAEISSASKDMEVESSGVIDAFRDVAAKAQSQSTRIADIAAKSSKVSLDGRDIELSAMASLFDDTLNDILAKVSVLSEHAVSMVAVLDGMANSLTQVENCIGKVDTINRQTKMLAVNARIEAARAAGSSGAAFGIVANEISQLSETTKSLAGTMRMHLGEVVSAIRESHHVFQEVAEVDMSANIAMRGQLETLVEAMIDRGVELGGIVAEAASDQGQISDHIRKIVTGMQFQDRVAQRLEQVRDTLAIVGDGLGEFADQGSAAAPGMDEHQRDRNAAWLQELAERYKLSDMRARFIARVISDEPVEESAAEQPTEEGSIELF